MDDNRPEYEETPRMAEFRRRKEKELRRRRRKKRLTKILVIVLVIWVVLAAVAAILHMTVGFDFFKGNKQVANASETVAGDSNPSAQDENKTLAPAQTKQFVESENTKETAEEEFSSEADASEAETEAVNATTTVKKHEDPREDVWNHYSNMFIASKVSSYLNVRNQPTTDGTIIGKLTKYSGGELIEDLGNGWWQISSGGIDGYIWSENCVTGDEAKEVALEHCMQMVEVTTDKLNVRSGGVWNMTFGQHSMQMRSRS